MKNRLLLLVVSWGFLSSSLAFAIECPSGWSEVDFGAGPMCARPGTPSQCPPGMKLVPAPGGMFPGPVIPGVPVAPLLSCEPAYCPPGMTWNPQRNMCWD